MHQGKRNKKEFIYILFIFLFAMVLRLIYVLSLPHTALAPDSPSWEEPAKNLLYDKTYGDSIRPPAYPLFLFFIYLLFGFHNVVAVRIFQSLLGGISCILIYYIGKKVFSKTAGFVSSFLLSFYPYLIFYTGVILCEVLLSFFICLTIFLLILSYKNPTKYVFWILSGISFGLTSLTKPVILVFFPFVILWIIIIHKHIVKPLLCIIIFFLSTFFTIGIWTLRNYFFYKEFLLISFGGKDFWLTNNDVAMQLETIGPRDAPAPDDWIWYPKERFLEILKLGPMQADKVFWSEGIKWVKENPKKFLWLVKRRFLRFWRLWPYMATRRNKLIAAFTSGIYIPMAWIGIILSLVNKKFRDESILMVFLFISFTVAYLPFHGMIRYRVPIDPIVLIFTGYTASIIIQKVKKML